MFHLPNVGAMRAPDDRTCEDRRRISRGPTDLSHRRGIKTAGYGCMAEAAFGNIVVPLALTADFVVLASLEKQRREARFGSNHRGWKP